MFKRSGMLSGVGAALSLGLCGLAHASGDLPAGMEAKPALTVLEEDAALGPYSYIIEQKLSVDLNSDYGYPSLDAWLTKIPIPAVKPDRATRRPQLAHAKKQVRVVRKDAPVRVKRATELSGYASRKIPERMPIIVGLFR
jgi:hypothetical protein